MNKETELTKALHLEKKESGKDDFESSVDENERAQIDELDKI